MPRLGLRTALVAYVGDDGQGGVPSPLRAEGVDASLVRLDPTVPTNRDFVLRVGHERTILVHHEQHDCHWPHLRPAEVPSWLYLSSIGTYSHAYEDQIVDWLESEPQVSLAFEPGTLQISRGAAALGRLFRRAFLVVCNREEAAALTGEHPSEYPVRLLDAMLALGPDMVVITDGSAGAFGSDGIGTRACPCSRTTGRWSTGPARATPSPGHWWPASPPGSPWTGHGPRPRQLDAGGPAGRLPGRTAR